MITCTAFPPYTTKPVDSCAIELLLVILRNHVCAVFTANQIDFDLSGAPDMMLGFSAEDISNLLQWTKHYLMAACLIIGCGFNQLSIGKRIYYRCSHRFYRDQCKTDDQTDHPHEEKFVFVALACHYCVHINSPRSRPKTSIRTIQSAPVFIKICSPVKKCTIKLTKG